jgi:hypothetical protein
MSTLPNVEEKTAHPLDAVLADQLNRLHAAGYGWALGLARDEKGIAGFKIDPIMPPVDDYEAPPSWRNHVFHEPMSLVGYAKRYAEPGKAVLFYDHQGIEFVIDETPAKGERETLTMPFEFSQVWKEWATLVGRPIPHQALRDCLVKVRHTMLDPGLLFALRAIKYAEEVKYDSEIREDVGEATYGVVFSVKGQNESLRNIPRSFKISVPVLDMDVLATERWATVEIKVELVLPTQSGQPLGVLLIAPAFEQARRARVHALMDEVRLALGEGWLVCNGATGEADRKIGCPARFNVGVPSPFQPIATKSR